MKNTLTIFLLSILAFSCSKNDFENTNLYLEFDKETYQSNDNFELTIKIYPTEVEKTIRFYKDLNNIEISFLSKAEEFEFHQKLKKRFIEGPPIFGDDSEYIDEYTISKEKPFEKIFLGTISESVNEIVFEIPELNIKNKIDKYFILKNPIILIKGNCRTVYGGKGKPFMSKEIEVELE
ncbi:hypothetical protein EYD45_06395 [Hyunsoonleella flava]|uniref:Uncharacterized protein n=1 Tax=Hyunsoonleella flava TaxID=2527939 RepID=A0A4Q9FFA8_9FLAO|nr:hypothetical protein [Hyunsoonleella flava]TBN04887.1 hypothetical protein EYD45_06395 [Hyunsoonleella flava]